MYIYFAKPFFAILAIVDVANVFTGDATFFAPGLGACGKKNTSKDLIVALSTHQYAGGSHCGKKIEVHYKGKSVDVTVVDECLGCGPNDIDLSPAAFDKFAEESLGRIPVTWSFL